MARFSTWIRLLTAVLLLTTVAIAKPKGTKAPTLPDVPISDNAQRLFRAGVAYVDDPSGAKWDEAYKSFLAAYQDSPSWKLKNNIGLCALHLERDLEAIAAYREYLAGRGRTRSQAA